MTEDGREYPDGLTPAERRVFDYLRAGTLDAETSVRLGLPIGDVKDRIERILQKTGAADRIELLAWHAPSPPVEPEPVIDATGEEDDGRGPEPLPPRRISRRAALGVLGVAAGTGVLAATGWLATRPTRHPADAPGQDAASGRPAPASVAADASQSPADGTTPLEQLLREERPSPLLRRTFASREVIPWAHGLFFMDTGTGEVEGWQGPNGTSGFEPAKVASGWFSISYGRVGYLVNRQSGRTISWDSQRLQPEVLTGEYAIIRRVRQPNDPPANHVFEVVRLGEFKAVARFELGPREFVALVSPDGTYVVIVTTAVDRAPEFSLLDLRDFSRTKVFTEDRMVQGRFAQFSAVEPAGTAGFVVRLYWAKTDSTPIEYSARFLLFDTRARSPSPEYRSDLYNAVAQIDERKRVTESFLIAPSGGEEWWPRVTTTGASPNVGVWSAALTYGDRLPSQRWLADGSAFVALVRSAPFATSEGVAGDRLSYAIVEPSSRTLGRVDLPPIPQPRWFEADFQRGAVPSPADSDVIAFGRLEAYNRRTGRWVRATMKDDSGPQHLDPWATGTSREMVFAWPHGGHGGRIAPSLLAPKVQPGGLAPENPRVRVVGAGDCLNVREAPGLDAKVSACVADRTTLALTPGARDGLPSATSEWRTDGLWAAVAAPDGTTGWVSSAYLEWAD